MRVTLTLPILVVAVALTLQAGPIVQYQVTTVRTTATGQTQYRYNYQFSGFTLFVNEEIDIRFDPGVFGELSMGSPVRASICCCSNQTSPPESSATTVPWQAQMPRSPAPSAWISL